MNEQVLLSVRTIMILIFNGIFIFMLSDFKISRDKAIRYLLLFLSSIGGINFIFMMVFGWEHMIWYLIVTIMIPSLIILQCMSKDSFSKTLFNYCFQVNSFFLIYFFSCLTNYLFHLNILTDMILRLFYFSGLLILHLKITRRQFREFANYIQKGWNLLAFVSFLLMGVFIAFVMGVVNYHPTPLHLLIYALLCMLGIGMYSVIYRTFKNTFDLMLKRQNEERMKMQIALQKEQYGVVENKLEVGKIFRHDLHHHTALLLGMLAEDQVDKAIAYLNKMNTSPLLSQDKVYCENLVVNTILSYQLERAKQKGIKVQCKVIVPVKIGIDEMELCTMLSNLLENAIEHGKGSPPLLMVSILQNKGQLCIRMENNFDGVVKQDVLGKYLSTKPQGSGIGLQSIHTIVKKYKGVMLVSHTDTIFSVDIAIKTNMQSYNVEKLLETLLEIGSCTFFSFHILITKTVLFFTK